MDYKASMTVKKTVIYILMVFFVIIALVPIYLMLINRYLFPLFASPTPATTPTYTPTCIHE